MDPEYAVLGRVARRIWARALVHGNGAPISMITPGSATPRGE